MVHCNLVNNYYQQAPKILLTFVPNKQFGQLITIAPHPLKILNTTNIELSIVKVWFNDQGNKELEIEDDVNMALIFG